MLVKMMQIIVPFVWYMEISFAFSCVGFDLQLTSPRTINKSVLSTSFTMMMIYIYIYLWFRYELRSKCLYIDHIIYP